MILSGNIRQIPFAVLCGYTYNKQEEAPSKQLEKYLPNS